MSEMSEVTHKLCVAEGELKYSMIQFGYHLAEREGYKEHSGFDAIVFYLVQKHNWMPSQVRAMNSEDLRFTLAEEMHRWTLPKDERHSSD